MQTDESIKQDYERMFGYCKPITPKERKCEYLSRLKGWDNKELLKLKSNQLGAIVLKVNKV